ncbi:MULTISPECIES: glycosyltransferase [unclassified Acinetobacter]|uniref:glycosyltransferase n=1 Tax=unclassified Acinetobacter TaxID=196816 RepID=UPI002578BEC8|nr:MULTISPECIES: glycosyltransferase [unclassified Acinetobacter]MDM1765539.1 glycosyltransferase [Acinetobacter sp. 226-1]MDM1769131.1 glycosyltransferase [Acinetobacter sp. 226-4]
MNKILFLSAIDFKDKSIQIVKKTPEFYGNQLDWEVDYIVARDKSKSGNYYYEQIVDLPKVNVNRFYWPFSQLRESNNRFIFLFFSKLASFFVIWKLFFMALKACKEKDYDYIYGYEMQGVLASNLLKIFFYKKKYISRFQGVYYIKEHFKNKKYLNLLFNMDTLIALWLPSDLLIMTDDGTQGDQILKKIKSKSLKNYLFISNGVEEIKKEHLEISSKVDSLENKIFDKYFIMVSRLVKTKRVHLMIEAFSNFIEKSQVEIDFCFLIVGDGPELDILKDMTKKLNIDKYFYFTGAVKNIEVYGLINNASAIFSLYESSNIGNPFFESMQCGTPMIAVNNGDTNKYIIDKYNGLLIDEDNIINDLYVILNQISKDEINLKEMSNNAKEYSKNNILSWEKRFIKEIERVKLISN